MSNEVPKTAKTPNHLKVDIADVDENRFTDLSDLGSILCISFGHYLPTKPN
jgi:hypothetical protein